MSSNEPRDFWLCDRIRIEPVDVHEESESEKETVSRSTFLKWQKEF